MKRKKYNIIGISGSPRDKGTSFMVETVMMATGYDYEMIKLKDKKIAPCPACGRCYKTYKCIIQDDMQDIYEKLISADAIVLGSPTYFDNITGLMKNFIDRCLPLYFSEKLKGKKAALVSVGNFKEGEVDFIDGYNPTEAAKDPELRKEMENSVKNCIFNMENFCRAMKLDVIGNVIAILGDAENEKDKLIELGQKLKFNRK